MLVEGRLEGLNLLLRVRVLLLSFRFRVCPEGRFIRIFGKMRRLIKPKGKMPKPVKWLLSKVKLKRCVICGNIGIRDAAAESALLCGGLQGLLCMGAAVFGTENNSICISPSYEEDVLCGTFRFVLGF